MPKRDELTCRVRPGQVYGKLKVISVFRETRGARRYTFAVCRHEDGTQRKVRTDHLISGASQGIANPSDWGGASRKHPGAFSSWMHMLDRCYNKGHVQYHRYGGRGILVCDRWRESFDAFLEDMGDRPAGTTLDRIDSDRGYDSGNCRWATIVEQNRNKTNRTKLTFRGQTMSVTEWAERLGIPRSVVFGRLKAGWTAERALIAPVRLRRWAKRPVDAAVA